jgi:hypothetical protein
MNDLSFTLKDTARPTLFTDDISIIYTNPSLIDFQNKLNEVFDILNNWFDKTYWR